MKVNIIGAGISGLTAANILQQADIEVGVLEASSQAGGRILSCFENDNEFYELGAEIIYGTNSPQAALLNQSDDQLILAQGENLYWYQQQLLHSSEVEKNTAVDKLLTILGDIESCKGVYHNQEMSLLDFIQQENYYTEDMRGIVEAFACEYGTTADKLGMQSLIAEENTWSCGQKEYYTQYPMQSVCEPLLKQVGDIIEYQKKISQVNYSDEKVILTDEQGNQYESDAVIISVNLGVLKSQDIMFNPALPSDKQSAIESIGMDTGIKVILRFTERWWDESMLTLEGGELCLEYLVSRNYQTPTLTGFIMGDKVKPVENLNHNELGKRLTQEMDSIFGHQYASNTLCKVHVKHWGKDPLHKGVYSYPALNAIDKREILSTPIKNKLYFIGEACNTQGHASTVHGAIESAKQACKLIISS